MINSSINESDFKEYSELIEQGMSQRSDCKGISRVTKNGKMLVGVI